jgi:hypothetical protein
MAEDRFSPERGRELAEANAPVEEGLRAQGVSFGPELPFRLTVMVLKDMLLEGDAEAQAEFEVRYQEAFADVMRDAQEKVNRARLIGNGGAPMPPPRLLRPDGG